MIKELICIVCPKGCHLKVDTDNDFKVTGNSCEKGALYGKKELTSPTRVITSTVAVEGGIHRRCPVKTDRDVPKEKIFDIMHQLDGIVVKSPVKIGDVIIEDVCSTGANIVAARNI